MKLICYYFLLFFIYSVLGWLMESIYVSILQKKIVNRGFLIGPYCPIYGVGSVCMTVYLSQYKDNFFTVFILGMVICSFLEYITSYLMEKIFKARWWDYSNKKFNLNGRICGENAILFGIGGLFIIYVTQPIIHNLITKLNDTVLLILVIVFFVIFVVDTIFSCNIVIRLKNSMKNGKIRKDSTQEFKNFTKQIIEYNIKNNRRKRHIFQQRLMNAFPDFDPNKIVKKLEKKKKNNYK